MNKFIELQDQSKKILFLGNNDESTDHEVSSLGIHNSIVNHGLCSDSEINFSATMVKLDRLRRGIS